MANNTTKLIETLRGGLSGFSNIEVVNRNPITGAREGHQGVLSVVFRAYDQASQRDVALKFFDPDFGGLRLPYRMQLFEREARLLERFQGKRGLLQLSLPLSEMDISATEGGQSVTLTCVYFAMEWLDGDIEEYFARQDAYDALVKLALFRRIVLGVFRMHRERIVHRDIKYDNMRDIETSDRERFVVPIDLGTAIDLDSEPDGQPSDYSLPVGARAFAPLEAWVGLADLRSLGTSGDVYALGCLLHDLFNLDYYMVRLLEDPGFRNCWGACQARVSQLHLDKMSGKDVLREYHHVLRLTKHQVVLPTIYSDDTTVPNTGREQLNRLLQRLTDVDYAERECNVNRILHTLDSATRSLNHAIMEKHTRRVRRQRRQLRAQKMQAKQARLELYLAEQDPGGMQC